jgi:hypothetical protein
MNATPSIGVESNGKPPVAVAVSVAPIADRVVVHYGDEHLGLSEADALLHVQELLDAVQTLRDYRGQTKQ